MAIKYYAQEQVFDLMCVFDELCRNHKLNYSLSFSTLLGADKLSGFLPDAVSAYMMMPFGDYMKFIDVAQEGLQSEYYLSNWAIDKSEHLHTLLKKRSKVSLPENRKSDETHYDYSIYIYPIIPVSDELERLKEFVDKYIHLKSILDAQTVGLSSTLRVSEYYQEVMRPLLEEDSEKAYKELSDIMAQENAERKYVYILTDVQVEKKEMTPGIYEKNRKSLRGIIKEKESYTGYIELSFEGKSFMAIECYEQWLMDLYEDQYNNEKILNMVGNIIRLKGYEELRRMQLIILDLMLEVERICKKHKINYAIVCGTLLGAVRHRGFVPWDYDADIAILKKDYDKFLAVAEEELDLSKYSLTHNNDVARNHFVFAKLRRKGTFLSRYEKAAKNVDQEIGIDIFPLYNAPDKPFLHKIQTVMCNHVFKPMLWANTRGKGLPWNSKNLYYKVASTIPLAWTFKRYNFFANMCEKHEKKYVSWLMAKFNPYQTAMAKKETYINLMTLEFEGYQFSAPQNYEEFLVDNYGELFNKLLPAYARYPAFAGLYLETGSIELDEPEIKGGGENYEH